MPEISISGEKFFEIFGFPVTNTFSLTLILSFGVFLFFLIVFKKAVLLPGKIQNLLEWALEMLYNFINSITNSREKTREIFPIVAALFLLILSANLIGLIPGVGVFSFLRSPSSDLNFTFSLALFSISYINILAIKKLGIVAYLKKFLNKNPLFLFVGLLEGMGEITRILSLSIRLFGNLFAGEVLLIVTSFLFAYLLPLPFLALEILVGFIQAFIFSSLVVIFYATSTELVHGKQ